MTTTIRIPELGEGVDSVDVITVLVAVGDRIAVDQPLIEVETDKAAVEVPATVAGTVTELHVAEGDSLGPAAPIVTVDEAADEDVNAEAQGGRDVEASQAPNAEAQRRRGAEPSQEENGERTGGGTSDPTPDDSDSDSGSGSKQGQRQEPATAAPTGDPRPTTHDSRLTSHDSPSSASAAPATPSRLVPAAPTVRRFAREVGIDIATVPGTGPGGRISIDDVKAEAARRMSRTGRGNGVGVPVVELPDLSRWGAVRREPMSRVRSLTADAMSRAWLTAPQVTNHDLADITSLEALRQRFKGRVEAAGGKLTLTAILVKVAASALKIFPNLNASVDAAVSEIVFKDFVTVGVAVDTERGLLVPVIRDADRKNITEIAVELDDLATRARSRKLKPDEMQGGTFSISNLGGIGGTGFSPIVNWPEVAILGVSRARIQPEWNDELSSFEPRLMLPLSLSYDHRLVDGAEAARFLRWIAEALEEPLLLALEG